MNEDQASTQQPGGKPEGVREHDAPPLDMEQIYLEAFRISEGPLRETFPLGKVTVDGWDLVDLLRLTQRLLGLRLEITAERLPHRKHE